jgi:hypothetical protein
MRAELGQMHRIYSCATFTIIASDGVDASYRLRGLEGFTAPRKVAQETVRLPTSETFLSEVASDKDCPSNYNKRAWTFQERFLPRRQLKFERGLVHWRCKEHKRKEDQSSAVVELVVYGGLSDEWFETATLDLAAMNDILVAYNKRRLSFPEDGFAAFVGVQTMLERFYKSRFIYGIPEFWFDIALNWTPIPWLNGTPLVRRLASGSRRSTAVPYQLPSWFCQLSQ